MKNLIESFGPAFLIMGIVFVCAVLPLWWLVNFAKREHKDWRIALVMGLLFSWLVGILVVLILPRLSDEEHARISPPQKPRRSKEERPEPVGVDLWMKPVLVAMGVCTLAAALMVGFFSWAV
jgi:small-conductance mechanosensitive channel